jgi:hypothetical protein
MSSELHKRRLTDETPFPPEDWTCRASASDCIDSLYRDEASGLARYLRWRTHQDEVSDFVQDSFRRLLGSGLVDYSQKMTVAAMQMADIKVCAQRS